MYFWKNLANFVGMKNSIDFLPERKQRDLRELVGLIRGEVKDVVMIILYGSYAKNTYVDCDERHDFGVKEYYMSDYDLLIVTKRSLGAKESILDSRIKDLFMRDKGNFQTYPQTINESIKELNNALSEGHYFYVDILTQGIILYDSGEYKLATPRELQYQEIRERSQKYFDRYYTKGKQFLVGTQLYCGVEYFDIASFQLHQATEYLLKTILLVNTLYRDKEHDLEFLLKKCKPFTLELAKVFPRDTPEEERLFKLLQRAYVEARYNDDFIVTKKDIDALLPKVERLRDIVEKVCMARIDYYKQQITQ